MAFDRENVVRRVSGFVVLSAVCLTALMYGGVTPFIWSALAILSSLLLVIILIWSLVAASPLAARTLLLPSILYFFVLVFCIWQASPASIAPPYDATGSSVADPGGSLQGVLRLGLYGMLFLISVVAFTSDRAAIAALRVIALWSSGLAAYGFYAFFWGVNPVLDTLDQGAVLKATFINRNHYATYAAFGLIANLGVYLSLVNERATNQPLKRRIRQLIEQFFGGAWLFAIGTLLCGAALVATASRAGAMSGYVGLLVFVVAWSGRSRKLSVVGYGAIALGLAFVLYSSATNLFDRFTALDGQEGRFLVYPAVWQGIWDRPIFGHGLGSFADTFPRYMPLEAARASWTQAHNSYLENAYELGLPVAALFYLSILLIVWRIFRATHNLRHQRVFVCVGLGCVAAAGLHSGFDFSLQVPSVTALFSIILGLAWAQSSPVSGQRRSDARSK